MNSIKYPTTINQTSGGHYRQFKDTVNIRNDNSYYAISNNVIEKKNETHNRPATLTLTNFKFKLPAGAVVKKVIVEYNHRKIGVQNDSPSVSVDTKMNIPAPTISLVGVNGYSGKGQAPANKWKAQKKTFKTNIDRTKINSKDFGVKINYPTNTTKYKGYIGIQYIRIKVEYVTPSFGITVNKTKGKYNKDPYSIQVALSNKNKTNYDPTVSVTAPPGLTIKSFKGPGKITKKTIRSLDWIPSLSTKVGNQNLQIVFDTDVTYPSGQSVYTGDLVVSENYSNIIKHHTVSITDSPIGEDTDTDSGSVGDYDNDPLAPVNEVKQAKIGEEIEYNLEVDKDMMCSIAHSIYEYGKVHWGWSSLTFEEAWEEIKAHAMFSLQGSSVSVGSTLSKNGHLRWRAINSPDWYSHNPLISFYNIFLGKTLDIMVKGVVSGDDVINLVWFYDDDSNSYFDLVNVLKFGIAPDEEDLSVPFHAILAPNEEETNRLGDGYSYTVQSYIRSSGYSTYYESNGVITDTNETSDLTTQHGKTANLPEEFTIEFDIKSTAQWASLQFEPDDSETPGHYFNVQIGESSNTLSVMYEDDESLGEDLVAEASSDTYYHIKICRTDGVFKIYVGDTFITDSNPSWFYDGSALKVSTYVNEGSISVKDLVVYEGSGDTYVRDWYKNARIGVFNNRIDENCTTYTVWDSEEPDGNQYRGIIIPAIYDITGKTLRITPDHDVWIDGHAWVDAYTHVDFTNLTDLNIPIDIALKHPSYSDTILTVELLDGNTVLWTRLYLVRGNQPETLEPYEYVEDTTDYTNLTDEQILYNAQYWGNPPTNVNKYTNVECEFDYEKDYPLYIIIGGDYPEATNTAKVTYTEPCIVESAVYTQHEPNGNFPLPIDDSIIGDGSVSELVIESQNQSSPFIFYNLDLEENYGTDDNIAIRGIELTADIEHSDELVLYATLKSPTGSTGQRSIILNESTSTDDDTNSFKIGGFGDLWGFSTLDLIDLNSWQVELTASNILNEEQSTLNFGNVHITFYIEQIEHQDTSCLINNENIAYYGGFLRDVVIPVGLKTDTSFLDINGTDTNDATRQNIREKEITLEIGIDGCNLTDTTTALMQLVKLLVNEKDEYNRPIPKRIEFEHVPNLYWEYIIEDTFETNIEISDYIIKAKLTIPSGTAYNKKNTTTSTFGHVQGLAAINPVITLTPGQATTIEITENNSQQSFKMTYDTEEWSGKIVEINCEDRIVWLKEDEDDTNPINITGGVDFNSSWFRLKGEYEFSSVNCTIRTVDYVERW